MIDRLDGSRPPRFREQELWGWGMRPRARCLLCRPPDRAGLKALLGAGGGTSLLGRGAGRSYGDASLNEGGGVADMRGLDRFLLFDRERGVLRAEAGVTIGEALEVTVPQGWFLPVVPGTRHVTLAGAVASDIHGKNHHRAGSIGRHLRALRILLASGEEVECSAEREPELLAATTGGMGLTGLILEVELGLLEVESSWMTVREAAATDLDHALELLEEGDARHSYSVAWIDGFPRGKGLGRGIVSFGDHAPRGALAGDRPGAPLARPSWRERPLLPGASLLLSDATVRAFNAFRYRRLRGGMAEDLLPFPGFFFPLDAVRGWNRLYGRRGFLQHQSVLPHEAAAEGVRLTLEMLRDGGHPPYLVVLKRLGEGGGGMLSFPREGVTLACDLPYREGLLPLLGRIDLEVVSRGGRVYLAKDAQLRADLLEAMYPRLDDFLGVKAAIDGGGRFQSSLSRRLGLT